LRSHLTEAKFRTKYNLVARIRAEIMTFIDTYIGDSKIILDMLTKVVKGSAAARKFSFAFMQVWKAVYGHGCYNFNFMFSCIIVVNLNTGRLLSLYS
jgi:hypothetical protein